VTYYGRKTAVTRWPFARDGKLLSKLYRVMRRKSSGWSWRLFQNYSSQRMGATTMIAVLIFCGLLICLFRLDLDDAESQG